jgi:hypothetical protein
MFRSALASWSLALVLPAPLVRLRWEGIGAGGRRGAKVVAFGVSVRYRPPLTMGLIPGLEWVKDLVTGEGRRTRGGDGDRRAEDVVY